MALPAADGEAYRYDGFVVPDYRLPPAQLDEMRAALERLMAENPNLPPERLIAPHIPRAGGKASPVYEAIIRPLATTSCWIAFDDATTQNGCLRALPGSHRARTLFPRCSNDDPEKVQNGELDTVDFY